MGKLVWCCVGWVDNGGCRVDFGLIVMLEWLGSRHWLNSGAISGLRAIFWPGLQGVRMQTGTRALTGGWSSELERCTTALLLAESLKLNVEVERDI